MKSHFHSTIKGWVPRFALRKRLKVIRKWPIRDRLCVSVPFSRDHGLKKRDIWLGIRTVRHAFFFLPITLDSHFEIALFDI